MKVRRGGQYKTISPSEYGIWLAAGFVKVTDDKLPTEETIIIEGKEVTPFIEDNVITEIKETETETKEVEAEEIMPEEVKVEVEVEETETETKPKTNRRNKNK